MLHNILLLKGSKLRDNSGISLRGVLNDCVLLIKNMQFSNMCTYTISFAFCRHWEVWSIYVATRGEVC
jgi:hypothetical protein